MRVLQIHTRYRQHGGEDVVVDQEAQLLRDAGHEVRQVTGENPETPGAAAGALALALWNPVWVRRVAQEAADFQPDVAHIHNTWFALSPAVIRPLNRAGVPVVMTVHNYRLTCANGLLFRDGEICEECVGVGPWKAVKYACYRDSRGQSAVAAGTLALHQRLGTWADGIALFIALTDFQKGLMARAGLPNAKIAVKPNFVRDPGPRSAPPSLSQIVLYVGRLSREKGIDLLIDAWREADTGDLELLVVGDGPLRAELEVARSSNVRFTGTLRSEEVKALMLEARVGVLPSRCYEGLPTVILEYFAAGIPVLASGHGPLPEVIVEASDSSWVVPEMSVAAWSEALRGVHAGDRCDDGGRTVRASYDARFTPAINSDQLLDLYARTIARLAER